jgi:hypothetical protein
MESAKPGSPQIGTRWNCMLHQDFMPQPLNLVHEPARLREDASKSCLHQQWMNRLLEASYLDGLNA